MTWEDTPFSLIKLCKYRWLSQMMDFRQLPLKNIHTTRSSTGFTRKFVAKPVQQTHPQYLIKKGEKQNQIGIYRVIKSAGERLHRPEISL